jgi:M6 family metalloprotease-like protein
VTRRLLLLLTLVVSAAWAPFARAAEPRALEVHRVVPPAAVEAAARAGRPARALRPADRDALELRGERQRAWRMVEPLLREKATSVGASLAHSRRPGWRPPAPSVKDGMGAAFPTPTEVDTIRLAVLRIDFLSDRGGSASTGDGRFNLDPSDTLTNPVDRPPHNRDFYVAHSEALSRYYHAQSYGRIRLEVEVWPPQQDSAYHLTDMADLGPWTFGSGIFRAAVKMMRDCFFAADSQSIAMGQRVPWNRYDRFMVIHAGSDLQSDLRQDSKEDIPSFTMFVDDTDRVIFPDSSNRERPIDRVAFIPETINQDDAYGAINGVIAHENGHNLFGLGDIYDINTALPVCGYWTLMDSGNLLGAQVPTSQGILYAVGLLPPSIDPFQRNFLLDQGLLDYRTPGAADTAAFELKGSQRHNDFVKIDLSSDEYVVLENRWLAPADAVRIDQDPATRVILGPREPDRYEYDALLPGGGILAWHVDESVIPFTTSLRVNPDYGFNSGRRLGLQILEADGLDDLGDLGSPYLLASPLDPWQASVAPVLSDDTQPSLVPNQGTRPHQRVEFLDDTSDTMRVRVTRTWQAKGWPVSANFPPAGPDLLAADLDRDGRPEVLWAGGDTLNNDPSAFGLGVTRDSAAIFAVRFDGLGLGGADTLDFAHLPRRPRPHLAVLPATSTRDGIVFATTERLGLGDALGGNLYAVSRSGAPVPGFPPQLIAAATTPPVVVNDEAGDWAVLVGCEDGRVRLVGASGVVKATSQALFAGPASGRLAWWPQFVAGSFSGQVAVGGRDGQVVVLALPGLNEVARWTALPGATAFAPDFLWARLGGAGPSSASPCGDSSPQLVVHDGDRVWAYCLEGAGPLPGWGSPLGDTLVTGLAAGDPDGDGFPEVVVQSRGSRLGFLNLTGRPSPGWSRPGTNEGFETSSPPLLLDLDLDGRPEIVALNGSGVIAALDGRGRTPTGWPLATGSGAKGPAVAADLDADGTLEVVAPDRFGRLYAYSVPGRLDAVSSPWRMVGGDPQRSCALSPTSTTSPAAPSPGPLVRGSFKAFPNPARRSPVQFAYQLTEEATVEFRILDSSGHEVTRFTRSGRRSDNLETWDPTGVPAGLYVARVRFSGPGGSHTESVPVGVLR